MKIKLSLLLFVAVFLSLPLKAQVKIGELNAPQPFSLLELSTANQKGGMRLPQLSNTQRSLLGVEALTGADATAAKGLIIYNTDVSCIQYWNGTLWVDMCSAV
jgi:hypothetical protein